MLAGCGSDFAVTIQPPGLSMVAKVIESWWTWAGLAIGALVVAILVVGISIRRRRPVATRPATAPDTAERRRPGPYGAPGSPRSITISRGSSGFGPTWTNPARS